MGDEIRINWDFNSSENIDLSKLNTNKENWSSLNWYDSNTFNKHKVDGDKKLNLRDGINASEAEYIVTKLEEGGYLDDGVLDDEEIEEYLKKTFNWSRKGANGTVNEKVSTDGAVDAFRNVYNQIKATYGKEEKVDTATQGDDTNTRAAQDDTSAKPKLNTSKPGLSDTADENGNYSVTVQSWGSKALDGNEVANDCLSRIIKNYYPDLKWGSDEYNALMQQIMDLNPQIYGTDENNPVRGSLDGKRMNTYIYDGEKITLPSNDDAKQTRNAEETEIQDWYDKLDSNKYDKDKVKEYMEKNPDATLDDLKKAVENSDEYKVQATQDKEAQKTELAGTFIKDYNMDRKDGIGSLPVERINNLTLEQLEALKNGEMVKFEVPYKDSDGNDKSITCAWQIKDGVLCGYGFKDDKEQLVWEFKKDGSQVSHEYPGDGKHVAKELNKDGTQLTYLTYQKGRQIPDRTFYNIVNGQAKKAATFDKAQETKDKEMFDEFEALYDLMYKSPQLSSYLTMQDGKHYPDTNNVSLQNDANWLSANGRNTSLEQARKVYSAHIKQMYAYIADYGSEADKKAAAKVETQFH